MSLALVSRASVSRVLVSRVLVSRWAAGLLVRVSPVVVVLGPVAPGQPGAGRAGVPGQPAGLRPVAGPGEISGAGQAAVPGALGQPSGLSRPGQPGGATSGRNLPLVVPVVPVGNRVAAHQSG